MSSYLDLLVMATVSSSALIGIATVKRLHKSTDTPEVPEEAPGSAYGSTSNTPQLVSPGLAPFHECDEQGLSLSLHNIGGDLVFQGISIQEHNELRVEFFPEYESQHMNLIPSGQALRFLLKGNYESATFHFSIIYSDVHGNTFSQKVAGWGVEPPLLEQPLELSA